MAALSVNGPNWLMPVLTSRAVSTGSLPISIFCWMFPTRFAVRGSRTGELLARCVVETGTNSFYSALADSTDEPVLKEICRRIAEDELTHYYLFFSYMRRYLENEGLTFCGRLRIAFARISETTDEELGSAYWAANRPGEHFERRPNSVAYARGA